MYRSWDEETGYLINFTADKTTKKRSGDSLQEDQTIVDNVVWLGQFHFSAPSMTPGFNSFESAPSRSESRCNKASHQAYGSFEDDLFFVVETGFGNVVKYMK